MLASPRDTATTWLANFPPAPPRSVRRRFLELLLPAEPATGAQAVAMAWVVLLAVFVVGMLTHDRFRLDALYLFPLAAMALHSREHGPLAVMFTAATCFQLAVLGMQEAPFVTVVCESAVAIGASALTVFLGRAARDRHLAVARLAETDSLTGLANRRSFESVALHAIANQRRYGGILSFALVDLDDFKRLNDTRGHGAGDRALAIVGEVLRDALRAADCSARVGGDEFAILLPSTRAHDCRALCVTLCETLARRLRSEGLEVTATIGSATFHEAPHGLVEALRRADEALYMAKAEGKGRSASLLATSAGWVRCEQPQAMAAASLQANG